MTTFKKILSTFIVVTLLLNLCGIADAKVLRTPPSTPTGMTAKAVSSSEIDLTWNSVSGASGYRIYSATPNDSNYTLIATVTGTSYKNTSLASSTTYWYYVTAYNYYGASSASTHVSATTLQPVPTSPTGLTANTVSTSEIDLSWTAVSGATGYQIFKATPNDSNYTQVATVTGTTYNDINLSSSTTYWYYVIAYNSYGTSTDSIHINATTLQPVPASPTGLTANTVSSSEIDMSWTAVAGASGYQIFKATPNDSNYTQVATVTGTTYNDTSLSSSTSYWYFVRAYNSTGASADSTHVNATTFQAAASKFLLGFATYYYSGDSSSYNSMVSNTKSINEIATDTYTTDGTGSITGLVPTSQVTYANSNGIISVAMITNNFSGSVAQTLLESSTNRQKLINNTLNAIKANNFKGVDVDIEGIYAADRSYFTTFMNELYSTLHPLGYEVSVCVPAKTSDSSANTWDYAYDYASLSKYSDRVVIMAYDEHYPGGSPGPIASIGWVQNVANYAVTVIPQSKILLGIAAYGYDWSSLGTKSYGINAIYNLASTYGATIQWDSVSQSPYFTYVDASGITHTVWFENETSVGYKLDIVNNMNLSGAAMWRLGLENSAYWTTVNTKLNK